jgi:hypothetical protein
LSFDTKLGALYKVGELIQHNLSFRVPQNMVWGFARNCGIDNYKI